MIKPSMSREAPRKLTNPKSARGERSFENNPEERTSRREEYQCKNKLKNAE